MKKIILMMIVLLTAGCVRFSGDLSSTWFLSEKDRIPYQPSVEKDYAGLCSDVLGSWYVRVAGVPADVIAATGDSNTGFNGQFSVKASSGGSPLVNPARGYVPFELLRGVLTQGNDVLFASGVAYGDPGVITTSTGGRIDGNSQCTVHYSIKFVSTGTGQTAGGTTVIAPSSGYAAPIPPQTSSSQTGISSSAVAQNRPLTIQEQLTAFINSIVQFLRNLFK